jgi:putative acetyltransferase
MNIHLRQATLSDLPQIHQLFVDTINHVCTKDYSVDQRRVWTALINNKERWVSSIQEQEFLIAESDGIIAGFASLEKTGLIDFLYVNKDFQRKGVANLLLTNLEEKAANSGIERLWSNVSETAKGFFEHSGYTVIQRQTKMVDNVEIHNYRMMKKVANSQ